MVGRPGGPGRSLHEVRRHREVERKGPDKLESPGDGLHRAPASSRQRPPGLPSSPTSTQVEPTSGSIHKGGQRPEIQSLPQGPPLDAAALGTKPWPSSPEPLENVPDPNLDTVGLCAGPEAHCPKPPNWLKAKFAKTSQEEAAAISPTGHVSPPCPRRCLFSKPARASSLH